LEKLIQYENGLKAVIDTVRGVKSVAAGIWVNVGSAKETPAQNGLSHFTEHVIFKGTDKLDGYGIADAFETLGAHVNAFTGKECTCYYVKSTDEYKKECFALLSHIFFDSVFNEEELDKERNVILEEINMVEDTPEDICYDLLASAFYGGSALGQTILGNPDNIKAFKQKDVIDFTNRFYCAQNVVISFAGNITPAQADKLIRQYILPKICVKNSGASPVAALPVRRTHTQRIKDFEQSNIAIGFSSLPFNSAKNQVQNILNIILGGGMSSRLFQAIREKLGLAYSVYSAPSAFKNNGSFNIVLNISPENTQKALDALSQEIRKVLCGDITAKEIARAKTQIKSALVFARENVQSIMSVNGKLLTLCGELYDVDKRIAQIDAVTADDVNRFAAAIFKNANLATSYVGKPHTANFPDFFQK